MFRTKQLIMGASVLILGATVATAQTTGTLTVTGTTPEAFAITNGSNSTVSATVALGTLTPASGTGADALTTATADVRLRSNKAFKLTAAAGALSVTSAGSAAGGTALALTDIGFGVVSITAAGANVASGRSDSILTGYDVSTGWPAATNGLTPAFSKTLADISGGIELLSGTRISSKGNLSTTDNFITLRLAVATLPQFFTPNSGFSSVVTLTIASQ